MVGFPTNKRYDDIEIMNSKLGKYVNNVKTSWNKNNGPAPVQSEDLIGGSKLEVIVPIQIDTTRRQHIVSDRFLSVGLDSNLVRNGWESFDFSSLKLRNLAKSLSPAYVRLMGTDGDRMTFNADCTQTRSASTKPKSVPKGYIFPTTKFYMYCRDWDRINRFAMNVGWRVLFGFNSQLRQGANWNPSNADQLLNYTIGKGYAHNIDFELGNQPEAYRYLSFPHTVDAQQLAMDYKTLHLMLRNEKYKRFFGDSLLGGPATGKMVTGYMKSFLESAGNTIDVVTWHQYYGGEEIRDEESAENPAVLERLREDLTRVMSVIRGTRHGARRKVWLGETGSIAVPPKNNVYESYAMCFMLLDKLGLSAVYGIDVVVLQTFYGLWFALVDNSLQPTPGYWVAALHKKLVGRVVLSASVLGNDSRHVRIYSHCTNRKRTSYNRGAITVFAMNLYDAKVELQLDVRYRKGEVHQFLLTPHSSDFGISSKYIDLNGEMLRLTDKSALPKFKPAVLKPGNQLFMPAKSLAFFVLPYADARVCMYK